VGTFVGKANNTRGTSGTLTINGTALGIAVGDYLVTFIAGRNAVDPTTLAGWTLVGSRDTSDTPSQFVYERTATAADVGAGGSYVWTLGDGGTGTLHVWRGVTRVDAIGAWGRVASGTLNIPSVTAAATGVLLAFYSVDANTLTWTPPAGMTEREDVQGTNNEAQTVGVASVAVSAGATGTKSPTPSLTSVEQGGVLLLLRDAAAAGSLAVTEGADTASFTGDVYVQGALAATEAADTAAIAGDVYVQGALAVTEAADTAAIAGDVLVQGALAATEAADTAAFTGQAGLGLATGSLAVTEAADTAAFAGDVLVQGALAATEAADTAALAGLIVSTSAYVFVVPVERRDFAVALERREFTVPTERRDFAVPVEQRTFTVPL
jgi:hypothetical protein